MDVLGPVTLRPGDRRIRAVVRGLRPPDDPWWVARACARCGVTTDGREGAVVVYGPHDAQCPAVDALCPCCAVVLTPFRLAVHRRLVGPAGSMDPVRRSVGDLVERIAAMRDGPPSDALWLRAADVQQLTHDLGMTRTHLGLRLCHDGVLAGVDIATDQRPGPARHHTNQEASA